MNLKYAPRSEDTEQINVVSWAHLSAGRYPELRLLHHIPNEGRRSQATGKKPKQLGMLAGVPDLHLPAPKGIYHSLYIEMKYDDGRISKDQKDFLSLAADVDNYCCVCYTATEVIEILREYLQLEEGEVMSLPNKSILNNGKHSVIKGKPSS